MVKLLLSPLLVCIVACTPRESPPVERLMEGELNQQQAGELEALIYAFAGEKNLSVRSGDRTALEIVSSKERVFFLELGVASTEDYPIIVSNVGPGPVFFMALSPRDGTASESVKILYDELAGRVAGAGHVSSFEERDDSQ